MLDVLYKLIVYLAGVARTRYLTLRYGHSCELCHRPVTRFIKLWKNRPKALGKGPFRLCAMHSVEWDAEITEMIAATPELNLIKR
jgi:hypothetical protein